MDVLEYARIAQAAYSQKPTFGDEKSAARAILSDHIVSFPGTNNIACWLADLNVETIYIPELGIIHEGFWNAFRSIQLDLMQQSPEIIVGHSEGAALSIIYAAMLCIAKKPPKYVYAFEPPRVSTDTSIGNLLRRSNVNLFLFKNGNDIVPDVPRLVHDWQHPCELIHIGKPSLPIPNVQDHLIENVIHSLSP